MIAGELRILRVFASSGEDDLNCIVCDALCKKRKHCLKTCYLVILLCQVQPQYLPTMSAIKLEIESKKDLFDKNLNHSFHQ